MQTLNLKKKEGKRGGSQEETRVKVNIENMREKDYINKRKDLLTQI